MRLFDDIERTYGGPANYSEDRFSYYNRSARREVAKIRSLLEDWFSRYPETEQQELFQRFRHDFNVALLELFLYELTYQLDLRCTIHPAVPNNTHKPDFLVKGRQCQDLILEAVTTFDETEEEKTRLRISNMFYDQINELDIKDYYVDLIKISFPSGQQPSAKNFKEFVRNVLQKVSYEHIVNQASIKNLPRWTYTDGRTKVVFELIPVGPEKRGTTNHRAIGIFPCETRWGDSTAAIERAIKRKAGRYGKVQLPFIIGVNILGRWIDEDTIDEMQALFGTEQYTFRGDNEDHHLSRKPDGIWYGPRGPQNTRVSGVLMCKMTPWTLAKAYVRLYHNPWANIPYVGPLNELPHAVADEGKMKFIDGVSTGQLFGIPPNWPHENDSERIETV